MIFSTAARTNGVIFAPFMPNIEASCSADSMATCMVSSPGLGLGTPTTIPLGDEEGRVGRMEGWGEGERGSGSYGDRGHGQCRTTLRANTKRCYLVTTSSTDQSFTWN